MTRRHILAEGESSPDQPNQFNLPDVFESAMAAIKLVDARELTVEVGEKERVRIKRQFATDLNLAGVAAGPCAVNKERRANKVGERTDLGALRGEFVDVGELQCGREDHTAAERGHPLEPRSDEGWTEALLCPLTFRASRPGPETALSLNPFARSSTSSIAMNGVMVPP